MLNENHCNVRSPIAIDKAYQETPQKDEIVISHSLGDAKGEPLPSINIENIPL